MTYRDFDKWLVDQAECRPVPVCLSFIPSLIMGALGGVGEAGNMITGKKQAHAEAALQNAQQNELNFMQQYQQQLANMTPGDIDTMLKQLTQPITSQQITAAQGPTEAAMASQGLGQAPGLMASELGTALAPMIGQNQNLAAQLLGMKLSAPLAPGQAILNQTQNLPQYFQQPTDPSGFFKLAAQMWPSQQGGPYPDPSLPDQPFNYPNYNPNLKLGQNNAQPQGQQSAAVTNMFTGMPFGNAGGLNIPS
jgi:hypothetical protein